MSDKCPPHVTVYELPDGKWRVVCGERRFTGTTKLAVAELGWTMQELAESNARLAELDAIVATLRERTVDLAEALERIVLTVENHKVVEVPVCGCVGHAVKDARRILSPAQGQEAKESDNEKDATQA